MMSQNFIKSTCGICFNNCGVLVQVTDGKVSGIFGDPESPVNRGKLCVKGLASLEYLYHPNRLKYPLRQAGRRGEGRWQRISWDEALDLVASELRRAPSMGARFIRGLGYKAIPCGNDTALSIPLAIDAGLGELGRNGLLITPEFGPRVRLSKVFTDLSLVPDEPIEFGVVEFCEKCETCARYCPSQAIIYGERTTQPHNISNNMAGQLKWPVNVDRCFWLLDPQWGLVHELHPGLSLQQVVGLAS